MNILQNLNDKIIRQGAYGVVLQDYKILLTQKKTGPYKGLWGLPGGVIEFGEGPEETLQRELLEECSLTISRWEFLNIKTATGEYHKNGQPYGFHQVGLIYRVLDWIEQPDCVPQEENRWVSLDRIVYQELTPFAAQTISTLPKNNSWRPPNKIRGKVIGLAMHDHQLLACEVLDDHGILKGWCPIGGGIEFGESAENAVKREIQEELRSGLTITGDPLVFENIFEHYGFVGHEIIFAFPIKLENKELYSKKRFQIHENKGSCHWVEWIPLADFKQGKAILYPLNLIDKIGSLY